MNDLPKRSATALVFGIVMIVTILFVPELFGALFLVIGLIGLREFYQISRLTGVQPNGILGMLLGTVMMLTLVLCLRGYIEFKWIMLSLPIVMLVFVMELYRNSQTPFQNIAATLSGVIYTFIPSLLSYWIAFGMKTPEGVLYHGRVVMGVMFLVWSSDTGAYFAGSKFGKHRLFERISPKKSWEGFFGGMILACAVSVLIAKYFTELNTVQWLICAVIVTITGTLGDLVESMLKRSAGVKDSGTILPGHGGILDRFDAFFLALPLVFCFLYFSGFFD